MASAVNDLTRELGAALGIALLGGLLTAGYQSAIRSGLDGVPPELADRAREGIASADATGRDAGAHAEQLVAAAQGAFITGWQQAMWVGVAALAVLLALVIVRGPEPSQDRR